MKKNAFLILAVLLSVYSLHASSISVSGYITTNTTWTGVDTVKVTGNLYVNNGKTLTIDPGIFVVFQGHYKMDVKGTLLAIGTETDTITFTVADTTGFYNYSHPGWDRIFLHDPSDGNDTTKIVYCKLEYGKAHTSANGSDGGAVYVYSFNKVIISNCLFKNNYAEDDGGAICVNQSNISVNNCLITDNYSDELGGGIYLSYSSGLELRNCIISNNSTNCSGGGIFCNGGSPLLISNLIANNSASYSAGIHFSNSSATVLNNSITDNLGEGVRCSSNSDPVFRNTIIYDNSNHEVMLVDDTDNPDFYYCDIEGGQSGIAGGNFTGDYENCINANPQFVGSGDCPYDLSSSSPCINIGDPATTIADATKYDLANDPRFLNGRIDIGAYEKLSSNVDDFSGTALEFDGIDDYVSVPSDASLNTPQFTVEFWMATDSPGLWQGILDKGWDTKTDWYFATANPGVLFGIGDGSARHEIHYAWSDSKWHHVAGTYDGSIMKLYVDGNLINTKTASYSSTTNNTVFGRRRNQSFPFIGKLDEVAIWNDVRTIEEIRENMHRTLTGNETGLIAYWQLNEGAYNTASDVINENVGILKNMDDSDWISSTVPTPFVSANDGNWETDVSWLTDQGAPTHVWSRAMLKHNITLNSNMELIEITFDTDKVMTISTGNTLTVGGD